MRKQLEIYIHIPFCVKKCLYCDFLSAPAEESIREKYVKCLLEEIRSKADCYREYGVSTVFIGGGTPSLLKGEQIERIMETLRSHFVWEDAPEVTMEVNPGTAAGEKLRAFRKAGINRLSIGLQSASNEELRALGRIHSYETFLDIYREAREAGFDNINVDLMSALPGQKLETWIESLRSVAALKPEHISAYSLIIEEGTPFYERYGEAEDTCGCDALADSRDRQTDEANSSSDNFPPLPTEDTERRMYEETERTLAEYGYHRYEISNYAKEGYECRHNRGYWERTDYVGFGIGAASLINNERFSNGRSLTEYLEGEDGCSERQKLSVQDQMEEFLFLGLRLTEGISAEKFEDVFGISMEQVYGKVIEKMEADKLLVFDRKKRNLRLTPKGVDVSNYVFAQFLF